MVLKLELGMEFIDSANPSENARPEQFKLLPLAGDECCVCVCVGGATHDNCGTVRTIRQFRSNGSRNNPFCWRTGKWDKKIVAFNSIHIRREVT